MNRIIISTSFNRLAILSRDRENKGLPLLNQHPIIGFVKNEKCFGVDFNDCDLLLIKDNLNHEQIIEKKLTFSKEEDYFIHHENSNGLKEYQNNLFKVNHILKGNHIANNDFVYYPLFKDIILNDEVDDKVSTIIERFYNSKINAPDSRVKKVFLEYIYNGNLPDDYQIPPSILDVDGINELIQYFKHNPYQKNDKGSDLCSESNIKYVQLMTTLGFKR